MASGDGLVVRLRPALGRLSPAQVRGIADLAENFGNGEAEVTNRANLQLRGVREETYPDLLGALEGMGLAQADAELEGRLNIVIDPFCAGAGDPATGIAQSLADGLDDAAFAVLPSKFGFVIDPGNTRSLAEASGDIRVEGCGTGLMVRAEGHGTGRTVRHAEEAVSLALACARWFIASGGVRADGRGRMTRHLAAARLPEHLAGDAPPNPAGPAPVPGLTGDGPLVAAAFGAFSARALRVIADSAAAEVRLTPWRMLFLPGVSASRLSGIQRQADLILDAADPLLRLSSCVGAPFCPQATVETRSLARKLAQAVPDGRRLHVSGCAKGCALPRACDLTLVGRAGAFDLVRAGAPWDVPDVCDLTPVQAASLIRR